jgi:hypothetical protein
VRLASRAGETSLHARITDRVAPGVVYTTFHHPDTERGREQVRFDVMGLTRLRVGGLPTVTRISDWRQLLFRLFAAPKKIVEFRKLPQRRPPLSYLSPGNGAYALSEITPLVR